MDELQAISSRHSVRRYEATPISAQARRALENAITQCNRESGLHIQLVTDEPNAFDGFLAHYGNFSGVRNYIALVGKKGGDLEETCGYYGEKLVLLAQTLGLNTCWVALTYSKKQTKVRIAGGEALCVIIAIGYGSTQGTAHKSKPRDAVMKVSGEAPAWFLHGVDAALLAPTAMNQQKFTFALEGSTVTAKAGLGFYSKIDLGIAKYHFELAAGRGNFRWG